VAFPARRAPAGRPPEGDAAQSRERFRSPGGTPRPAVRFRPPPVRFRPAMPALPGGRALPDPAPPGGNPGPMVAFRRFPGPPVPSAPELHPPGTNQGRIAFDP